MNFRTRKHFAANDWVGQLLSFETSRRPLTGKKYRLFIFWRSVRNPYVRFPFELQYVDFGTERNGRLAHWVFPKRRKR